MFYIVTNFRKENACFPQLCQSTSASLVPCPATFLPSYYDVLASSLLRLADCNPQSIAGTLTLCSASADRVAATAAFINVSLGFIENTSGFPAFIPNIGKLNTLGLDFKRQCSFLYLPSR
jgi:hypothetical protein